jgi:hypothetical protein
MYRNTRRARPPAAVEDDYAASCKDGNKYHVYLNAAGRVIVEKQ